MGEAQKTVRIDIEPGGWNEFARELLERATGCKHAFGLLNEWQGEVEAGRLELFWVRVDGLARAVVLMRIEFSRYAPPEGVIVAAAGEPVEGVRLVKLLPMFERKFSGVHRVRIHTRRRGLVKYLAGSGYELNEFVCVKRIG